MNFRLLILAATLNSGALAQESTTRFGLHELWKKAEANNPAIAEAKARVESAMRMSQASNSIFLPTIDMSSEYTQQQSREKRETPVNRDQLREEGAGYTVYFTQNIYNKQAWNLREKSRSNHDIAEAQLRLVETNVSRSVLDLYWQILSQGESIAVLESSLEGPLAKLERQAQDAISSGIRSSADLNAYLMQISTLRLKLLRLKAEYDENREQLSLLVGETVEQIRGRKSNYDLPQLPIIPYNLHPELKIEQLNVKNEYLRVNASESKFWPTLSLNANFQDSKRDLRQSDQAASVARQTTQLSLNLNISLFNGLSDFRERQATKAAVMGAEIRRDSVEKKFKTRAGSSPKRLAKARERLLAALELRNSTDDLERSVLRRQDAGLMSFDLIIGPRVQALNLRLTLIETLFEFLSIETREFAEAGILNEEAVIQIEEEILAEK